ncbi:DUF2339 domain-containing protein [Aquincola sp. S2]|uniref:DUF2339 domain-containing protein n=1 Tax=Pseudaquabacterium terrae TaxID=2732868 RepID=A0ABX2EB99_9BURK|nr:DUF2339 domain-containing protein [Aquabacterium terrae]NRF66165.1 DUF2339 domain-containing protein [Aquabacterium terrae]
MLVIVAIVVGALLGGAMGNDGGAVLGALIGWLGLRSWRQQRQLDALQRSIAAPAAAAAPATPSNFGPDDAPTPAEPAPHESALPAFETPAALSEAAAPTLAVEAAPALSAEPMPVVTTAAVASEPPPPPQPPRPDLFAPLRAWFFGGNTIVKAGVAILFLGLAFLAKYASEHVELPIEFRLAGIGAAAIALLVVGWRLRTSRPGYAQALQGGAIAVLYLTLFVAFKFYGVLAVGPVFALMVVIAALAAALAVLQDARALAVIGALGGFATPLLVSTGGGNQVALFSYYLVLDLGIAAVAWFRTWRVLNLIGFVFTFAVGSAWGLMRYTPEDYASSQAFLIAYFLLFVLVLLLPARRAVESTDKPARWINGSLLFGLPTVAFALQYGLVQDSPYGVALSALVLAGFYVALAAWMRKRPGLGLTFEASLAIGTVFLTLVIPFALDARSTAGAWSLEGAGLVWLGLRQRRGLPRAFGYALLLLAGVSMLIGHEHHGTPASPWNAVLFNALMAATGSLVAAYFVRKHTEHAAVRERFAEPLLIGWATLWLLSAALLEIEGFVPWRWSLAAWLLTLAGIGAVYTAIGARWRWPGIAGPVLGFTPLLLLAAAVSAVTQDNPLNDGGWLGWPAALLVHALSLKLAAPLWPAGGRKLAHALGALLVAALAALLGRALTSDWGDGGSAWPWLGWLVGPALLLLLLPRPGHWWPLREEPAAYRSVAAGVLSLGLLLWVVLANIGSTGSARPLPHVPLLNPLDIGIALALAAVALWARSEGAEALRRTQPAAMPALLGAVGFLWLNAMLVRAFHHGIGVPYRFDAWSESLPVQTGLTLLWSSLALALMWWSARRAQRAPWLAGAVLLGAVVLKLMLVDLSGSGTVTRIVSFIGVGLLMLVIGYVAPLPSGRKDPAPATEGTHAA